MAACGAGETITGSTFACKGCLAGGRTGREEGDGKRAATDEKGRREAREEEGGIGRPTGVGVDDEARISGGRGGRRELPVSGGGALGSWAVGAGLCAVVGRPADAAAVGVVPRIDCGVDVAPAGVKLDADGLVGSVIGEGELELVITVLKGP